MLWFCCCWPGGHLKISTDTAGFWQHGVLCLKKAHIIGFLSLLTYIRPTLFQWAKGPNLNAIQSDMHSVYLSQQVFYKTSKLAIHVLVKTELIGTTWLPHDNSWLHTACDYEEWGNTTPTIQSQWHLAASDYMFGGKRKIWNWCQ